MSFRLVDSGWNEVLGGAFHDTSSEVRIVCPFIKMNTIERLLRQGQSSVLQIITRFNLGDFADGVSDLAALRFLLEKGAQIRGVRNLHAKLYIFDKRRVVVTSANLTDAGLTRNQEFGFVAEDAEIVARCRDYFDDLWKSGGNNLVEIRLEEWERVVMDHLAGGARPTTAANLLDYGSDAGIQQEPIAFPAWVGDAGQGFVKFFGEGHNRAEHTMQVLDEVRRSGCHKFCAYPRGRRPRQVRDGALMFMGRLVQNPNDILIFGRAVGMAHQPERDDATDADIQLRAWLERWPHLIRLHHAEFVAGSLANGVSLAELMDALGSNAFASTQENAARGEGNTNPRHAIRQQPAVRLSPQGQDWLNRRLENSFDQNGQLAPARLKGSAIKGVRLPWH